MKPACKRQMSGTLNFVLYNMIRGYIACQSLCLHVQYHHLLLLNGNKCQCSITEAGGYSVLKGFVLPVMAV